MLHRVLSIHNLSDMIDTEADRVKFVLEIFVEIKYKSSIPFFFFESMNEEDQKKVGEYDSRIVGIEIVT